MYFFFYIYFICQIECQGGKRSEMIYFGVIFTSQKPCSFNSFYIDRILKQMLGSLFHTVLDGCHETDGL